MAKDAKATKVNTSKATMVGYDSSFLSFAIVILGVISMLKKYNNIDIATLNICDFDFFLMTATILFTAMDMIVSYHRFGKNSLIICIRILAWVVLVLSGAIIASEFLVWGNMLTTITTTDNVLQKIVQIGWSGNFGFFLHENLKIPYLNVSYYFYDLGIAIFFQFIANILKIILNKKMYNNKI